MSQQNSQLDAFFKKAKSESPVFSDNEINRLLDEVDLHGQQSNSTTQTPRTDLGASQTIRKQRIIMSSIAAILLGGLISAGALFFNPGTSEQPLSNNQPSPAIAELAAPMQTSPAALPEKPKENTAEIGLPVTDNSLNEKGKNEQPVDIPQGGKEDNEDGKNENQITVEEELSQELQHFVESYWLNKINGYKNQIDRMLDPASRDELDRLRVRYALAEDSDSPFNLGMKSKMRVSSNGSKSFTMNTEFSNNTTTDEESLWVESSDASDGKDMEFDIEAFDMHVNDGAMSDDDGKDVKFGQRIKTIVVNGEEMDDADLSKLLEEQGITLGEGEDVVIMKESDGEGKNSISVKIRRTQDVNADVDISVDKDVVADSDVTVHRNVTVQRKVSTDKDGNQRVFIRENTNDNNTEVMLDIDEDVDFAEGKNSRQRIVIKKGMGESSPEMNWQMENFDMKPIVGMLKATISADKSEASQIIVSAWNIAEDNRAELDALKATIFEDLTVFNRELQDRIADFVASHRDEMPAELAELLTEKANVVDKAFPAEGTMIKTIEPLYEVIIEPMILLYNGSDINGMLSSAIAEPVAGVSLEANTTLKQSYPNPATSEATIEYTLQQASTGTVLRVFDAKGSQVKHVNLGAQSVGTHSTVVSVADLPGGTYLYHLTTTTPQGEQVFSKAMQVVR